ncbi:MAG: Rieske 2Fe-2S domain-containing protein [Anaerolineae bacterium]|nr:Rieske 2Fe-2S domain-containing protein [Anaerolineae bacterium]
MLSKTIDNAIDNTPILQEKGAQTAKAIHQLVLSGGKPARKAFDFLHGTWLGHPIHPLLTDIVVGAWSLGALFDVLSLGDKSSATQKTADTLTAIGTAAVIPTALTGMADFSTIPKSSAGTGLAHAVAADISLGLYLMSLFARKKEQRGWGIFWSMLGFSVMTLGAYLGGHLVFKKKVGVNRLSPSTPAQEWTAVLDDADLLENQPETVTVDEQSILLYRKEGRIYAVGAFCPHAEAPLADGTFCEGYVECPWHQSVFNLSDGSVVHGPSTYPLPSFDARIRDGRIEIRAAG